MNNTHTLPTGQQLILIPIPEDATNPVIDNAIEYLVYKIPNYKNWVTDETLEDYGKLQKYLATAKEDEQWITTGKRIHGQSKILGKFCAERNEIDFEVKEEWVERSKITHGCWYKDYGDEALKKKTVSFPSSNT